jgi:hypothetical protein
MFTPFSSDLNADSPESLALVAAAEALAKVGKGKGLAWGDTQTLEHHVGNLQRLGLLRLGDMRDVKTLGQEFEAAERGDGPMPIICFSQGAEPEAAPCEYVKPATYGEFLDGNPCAKCGKMEALHKAKPAPLPEVAKMDNGFMLARIGHDAGRKLAPVSLEWVALSAEERAEKVAAALAIEKQVKFDCARQAAFDAAAAKVA